MADLIDFSDETEEAVDALSNTSQISDYPQTLVTEKIIFVVDILLLNNDYDGGKNLFLVPFLTKTYLNLKKKTCVKPPEFECLLYNSNTVIHSYINNEKDLKGAFTKICNAEFEDGEQPLQIDKIFDKIANLVEFPHPDSIKKSLPPNWVYHVVWLFNRNIHMPTMENTNSFDFLMMSPYFALDILYLHDVTLPSNQCEQISQALLGLNENGKGYFLSISIREKQKEKFWACFAQFLGHPLIRVPQVQARFNINELGYHIKDSKNNNDEE